MVVWSDPFPADSSVIYTLILWPESAAGLKPLIGGVISKTRVGGTNVCVPHMESLYTSAMLDLLVFEL